MAASDDYLTGYQAYDTEAEDESPDQFLLSEEPPVHVHTNGNGNSARWNHIENLDDFFTRVYTYHQRHGFMCMLVEDALQLGQFLFIVLFTGFLTDCVDYDILFDNGDEHTHSKQTLHDVIKSPCNKSDVYGLKCGFSIPAVAICMLIAFGFLFLRAAKVIFNLFKYWEIRQFYSVALKIEASNLDNKTWCEVQTRLMEVQRELQMCIHKNELTQLDIYHRILRFKNYFISMINKSVIPLKFNLPFIGEFCYLSHGLKFNLEFLLFWAPCNISPFENPWHLRAEYKNVHRRIQLSEQLSKNILILGIVNLVLSPVIFLWEILYLFFVYGNLVKREPGFLGSRTWSGYGRAYLRHFNELDHELNTRLSRAYAPSDEYLSGFVSPIMCIIAKFVSFFAGAILVVLVCLTIYDEDTLQIEHMLTLITVCGVVTTTSRIFIPPENRVFVPETKMTQILAHTHYQPDDWKDYAHTSRVREQFSQLFQFKAIFLLEELLSPIMCPLILIFSLRPKSLKIVDFFRNFTIDVLGVGDVCSFAQLDIKKHGNKKWSGTGVNEDADSYQQAELGKTELSLMHFALTNPGWKPPSDGNVYLKGIREQAVRDASDPTHTGAGMNTGHNPLTDSLMALSAVPHQSSLIFPRSRFSGLGTSSSVMFRSRAAVGSASQLGTESQRAAGSSLMSASVRRRKTMGGMSQHEGPLSDQPVTGGIIDALGQSGSYDALVSDMMTSPEYNSNEMSLSVIYMHELRRRNQLNNITQAGYEDLESVRQVLTESELRPVPEYQSINEEFGSATSSPSSSQHGQPS